MKMQCTVHAGSRVRLLVMPLALLAAVVWGLCSAADAYQVWVTDQSDTGKDTGGFLYIYNGGKLAAKPSEAQPDYALDLAGDVRKFCEDSTKKPIRRPHMLFFTTDQSHAILSFLSGQVLFMDAETRKLEACLNMGKNVHAAWPTPDMKMVLAANMADKKLIRIWTDYKAHQFGFDPAKDVMNLAAEEGGERPDATPICPVTDASSKYAFITLRGGGLFVVDVTETPMRIVATLDNNQIHPAGCGGVQAGNIMFLNSGGGWPVAPLSYDVYALNISDLPKSVSVKLITSRDTRFSDSHGMAGVGRYVWSADRAGNEIEIIDSLDNLSVGSIDLNSQFSGDPAPDLLAVSPDGAYVFMTLRGPTPLTGNAKEMNNAQGSTPGVGVIKVMEEGKNGQFIGVDRITNMKDGKEPADPHGIAVRK